MTDEQIIEALQRCFIVGSCSGCAGCPLKPKRQEDANCIDKLVTNTIDLIKRQQAEIERLKKEHDKNFEKWEILDKRTKERYAELYETAKGVVRAEAIKEFAERLKAKKTEICTGHGSYDYAVYDYDIDNLVKEMGCGNA